MIVTFKMQDPKIRPKRMIDIEGNCVKAVETYMQVKAESNDFIRSVHKTYVKKKVHTDFSVLSFIKKILTSCWYSVEI